MVLKRIEETIGGKRCTLCGGLDAPFWLIQPVDQYDLEGLEAEAPHIEAMTASPFCLAAFRVEDWDNDLTPWAWDAGELLRGRRFGDGAGRTLAFVERELLPWMRARRADCAGPRVLLGGYSLAGLFALWGGYASACFEGVAGVSPSVWYVNWTDFAQKNAMKARYVYLSQGDREARGRGPMGTADQAIRRQYRLLGGESNPRCALEWNPGNHFREPDLRTAKGFAWLMNRISGEADGHQSG